MKKTVLNTALSTAFIVAFSFGVSACGGHEEGESHEVLAKDRVDAASALARENAPDAEEFDFPETAVAPVDGTEATDEAGDTDAATEATTDDSIDTDTDAAATDSTDMEAADADTAE
ncbi:hypothetical protein ACT3R9_05680 [Psychrobacter sp. AOP42-A1-21]|uniref:hypothetical protein n=1 Tax=Psychrobacter sp. AOP42-A1-21 TaxID=3457675 RepID=UPI00403550FE